MDRLKKLIFKKDLGQTLIELLITIGLAAILIPALLTGFSVTRGGRAQSEQRIEAVSYVREAEEALRIIKTNSWDNLVNGTFHPAISGTTWVLSSGAETIEGTNFTRQIVIEDVFRDSSGNIVESLGNLDPSTKRITISVSWETPTPSSVTAVSYLTRHTNLVHLDTTVADFNEGADNPETVGVEITDTQGGEITLSAGGGGGDWCEPSLAIEEQDLPKSGVANAVYAIEGKVFAGTGENASGVSYASVDVTTNFPPVPTLEKTFDGFKTNGVFGEENFAYLATDNNFKEIVIINLNEYSDPPTNSKYKEEGYFNAPGNGNGNSIYVYGNYGYETSGNKFYVFDVSEKSGSRPQVNSTVPTLSGTGLKIQVVGNYAYIATSGTTNQLQILDISNPSSPAIVGQVTVNGAAGKDVSVSASGTRAYLVTASSESQNELFIINTENKTSPTLVSATSSYDTGGMSPKGVAVATGNRVIVVGVGGTYQYQVVNIDDENSPLSCGNLQILSGVNGVSSVLQSNGYAYSYIITGDANLELKIILGGAGDDYNSSGVYESATIDAGKEVAWNSISATASVPSSTTLQYKVAVKDAVSASCSLVNFEDADFLGEEGTATSFFQQSGGIIPFDNDGQNFENPGWCARYRAYFTTTDVNQTPVLYDVSLNYSP